MVGVSPGTEARRAFFLPFFGTPFLRRASGGRCVESGWWMWWDDWRWSGGTGSWCCAPRPFPASPPPPARPLPAPRSAPALGPAHTRSPPRRSCARPPRRCGGERRSGSPRSAPRPGPCSGPSPPPPRPRRQVSRRPAPPARAAGGRGEWTQGSAGPATPLTSSVSWPCSPMRWCPDRGALRPQTTQGLGTQGLGTPCINTHTPPAPPAPALCSSVTSRPRGCPWVSRCPALL